MIILGDVHGEVNRCFEVCNAANLHDSVVQLGDLGIGFNVPHILGDFDNRWAGKPVATAVSKLPSGFHFFVGNHDNRQMAKKLPSCLGDYGEFENVFFVSGGRSHDQWARVEGVSWWRDEELTGLQASDCLDKWKASDKDILIAHDCPQSIAEGYLLIYDRCITRTLLDAMITHRRPKLFVFGHHHKHLDIVVDGTRFVCLNIGETIRI
jgi:predicted phosphodiesterase